MYSRSECFQNNSFSQGYLSVSACIGLSEKSLCSTYRERERERETTQHFWQKNWYVYFSSFSVGVSLAFDLLVSSKMWSQILHLATHAPQLCASKSKDAMTNRCVFFEKRAIPFVFAVTEISIALNRTHRDNPQR